MTYPHLKSLLLTLLTTLPPLASSSLPLTYLTNPTTLWNQAIQTIPSQNNDIAISPDNTWLYTTSVDLGTLSKLNPDNGKFVQYYDALGKEALEGGRFVYGQGGVEFYMDGGNGEGSYLLYWVLDVSQQGYYSKVICVEHDGDPESEQIVVRWVVSLSGILSGMPKMGSDGTFIYLTINADTNTPISVNTPADSTTADNGGEGEGVSPSEEPPASSTTNVVEPASTPYWFLNVGGTNNTLICDYGTEFPEGSSINGSSVNTTLFGTRDECCVAQPLACEETLIVNGDDGTSNETTSTTTTTTGEPAEASSTTNDAEEPNRKLQAPEKSGRFIILHADTGSIIYSFDSRSDFTIRKHDFGPLGIVHRPAYGNYAGGEGNTNDVVMWGSGSGPQGDDSVGETLLFQLPKGFDTSSLSSSAALVGQFETRLMESVSWTTEIAPTFSKDGLAVYFLISGDRLTGWNNGQKFDVAPNVGPVDLSTAGSTGGIQRPMVLTDDDKTLLVGVQDTMYGVDVSTSPISIGWQLDTFGSGAGFTTPQITPDGKMAYFGKSGALHAVNLDAGGSLLWEDTNGYVDPFSSMSQITMADFSLDASGQILYYCRGGSDTITALKIGSEVPTQAPTLSPSGGPSVTASMSPSTSVAPTVSISPSYGVDYVFPSVAPSESLSGAPSMSPSAKPTVFPTKSATPTINGTAFQLDFTGAGSPTPTNSPNNTAVLAGSNPTTTLASPAEEDGNASTLPLSMSAIIGIAVGGGIGLILLLGSLCYVCRKKPCKGGGEDDGVDTDWQSSNEAHQQMQFSGSGGENQAHFQYGDEESDHRYGGEPLKW